MGYLCSCPSMPLQAAAAAMRKDAQRLPSSAAAWLPHTALCTKLHPAASWEAGGSADNTSQPPCIGLQRVGV